MFLETIKLTYFKNYENQTFDFSEQLNCLVGKNGMGKTNVLDAIYYLCLCKSHFSIPDRLIIKHQQDFFRLEGTFRKDKKEQIVCKYDKRKKVIERNKVAYARLAEHIGLLPVIMITPDDTLLITEGSENRRRFMDLLLVQSNPQYLTYLMEYNKLLHQRNAFLKQYKHPNDIDAALLEIYDAQMIAPATYIHQQRHQFCQQLQPIFKSYYQAIAGANEPVNFVYQSQLSENSLPELFLASREKDSWLQRTTKGIHKDDMKLTIDGYPVKKFASQGQLKSYLLALKLGQYELLRQEIGSAPLLLLDDIFDKLDRSRVQHLLQLLIEKKFGQLFITDTHPDRIAAIAAQLGSNFKQFDIQKGVATNLV
jgi:DNA replication and repair protein RecF